MPLDGHGLPGPVRGRSRNLDGRYSRGSLIGPYSVAIFLLRPVLVTMVNERVTHCLLLE